MINSAIFLENIMGQQRTWDIGIRANVAEKLAHESVTETPDLAVRLALGVKVRSTLSSTHAEAGEGVFEGLFEAEELEDGQVHRGVETQTTFIGTKGRVVLTKHILVQKRTKEKVGPT
jgi:hypothetical protein